MNQIFTYLLIGLAIGGVSSLIGACVSWAVYLRNGNNNGQGALGCVFLVSSALVLIGFIALVLSIPSSKLGLAIATGTGVFIGFAAMFTLMLSLWIRMQNIPID